MTNESTLKVKNDSARLKGELEELKKKNPYLRELLFDLADWIKETLNKDMIITMIFRTQEEQDEIYKNDKKYQKKKFKSCHQLWQGTDIRSFIYTPEEITEIENWLNSTYNPGNHFSYTAKCHAVPGGAPHFHLQAWPKGK